MQDKYPAALHRLNRPRRTGQHQRAYLSRPTCFRLVAHSFFQDKCQRIVKPGHRVHGDRTRKTYNAGYEYLHIVIDDYSRISFAAILPDQTHASSVLFFHQARAHFSRFGISVKRVLTDNGSCYRHWRFLQALRNACVQQRFIRPYTPRTNGKAERFIQTALREWAYARSYENSAEREQQLDTWLHEYNFHRPHVSLKLKTPASKSGLYRNNLLSLHN